MRTIRMGTVGYRGGGRGAESFFHYRRNPFKHRSPKKPGHFPINSADWLASWQVSMTGSRVKACDR